MHEKGNPLIAHRGPGRSLEEALPRPGACRAGPPHFRRSKPTPGRSLGIRRCRASLRIQRGDSAQDFARTFLARVHSPTDFVSYRLDFISPINGCHREPGDLHRWRSSVVRVLPCAPRQRELLRWPYWDCGLGGSVVDGRLDFYHLLAGACFGDSDSSELLEHAGCCFLRNLCQPVLDH